MAILKKCDPFSRLKSLILLSLKILLALILLISFPFLLLLLSPILMFRYTVSKFCEHFKTDLGKILCARSTIFTMGEVYKDPKNVLVLPFVLEGTPDINKIRKEVLGKLVGAEVNLENGNTHKRFPELKQNLVEFMGFLFWKDLDEFEIEDHVYMLDFEEFKKSEKSGSLENSWDIPGFPGIPDEHQLAKYFLSKSWSKEKALWEIIIVENVPPWSDQEQKELYNYDQPSFLVMFRFHHGLVDGFSVLKMLMCIDQSGNIQKLFNARSGMISESENRGQRSPYLANLKFLLKAPYDLAGSILQSFNSDCMEDPFKIKNRDLDNNSSRSINKVVPLSDFRMVKNRLNVGFTSLFASILATGVRKYFDLEELGKGQAKKVNFRFPVPLRGHSYKLRNCMSFATIKIDFGEKDGVRRVKGVQEEFDKIKRSTLPLTLSYLTVLGGCLPLRVIRKMVNSSMKEELVFVSNFPGPEEQFDCFGDGLLNGYFAASVAGTAGLVFSATTNQSYLSISVGADTAILKTDEEANKLLDLCIDELNLLKKLSEFEQFENDRV